MPLNIIPLNPGPTYCVQSDVEDEWGTTNVRLWSNKGDNSIDTANVPRINIAILDACEEINRKLLVSIYIVPLQPLSDAGLPMVARWARVIAGYRLCDVRDTSPTGKQFKAKYDEVIAELDEVASKRAYIPAVQRADGFAGLPSGVAAQRWSNVPPCIN